MSNGSNRSLLILKWVGSVLWYLVLLYVLILYMESRVWIEHDDWMSKTKAVVGTIVIVGMFVALHLGAMSANRLFPAPQQSAPIPKGPHPFPSPITVAVGIWLIVISVFSIAGLLVCLNPPNWPASVETTFPHAAANKMIRQVLITIFAAGVGSCVTTIMGFLLHASENQDFDPAYAPWYVARPVLGMLMGLIFYVAIVGGLAAINVANTTVADMNEWALAGIAALVGLFSKNAIEKLREIFNTMFKTQ